MRRGLRDNKDDCPFMRNSAGFIQWSLQTPSGFPGKVLRSQAGEFRASPCQHLLRNGLEMKSRGQSDEESCCQNKCCCVLAYPTAEEIYSTKI